MEKKPNDPTRIPLVCVLENKEILMVDSDLKIYVYNQQVKDNSEGHKKVYDALIAFSKGILENKLTNDGETKE